MIGHRQIARRYNISVRGRPPHHTVWKRDSCPRGIAERRPSKLHSQPMRCQKMITRGEMDIFILQAPKVTSNENDKDGILSQKDLSKRRSLKTKYTKLFKKFLDQKDA